MKVTNQTAVSVKKNHIPFSIRHITTFGINDVRVSAIVECQQNDKIHAEYSQFSRLSPLVAPTFGNFKVETHAFFVPLRTIWLHYGEYMNNSKDSSFSGVRNPINFSLSDVFSFLYNLNGVSGTTEFKTGKLLVENGSSFDFQNFANIETSDLSLIVPVGEGSGEPKPRVFCYNFTDYGRLVWNTFQSLGYTLPTYFAFANDNRYDAEWWSAQGFPGARAFFINPRFSVYPLLAMARCYYDWLFPSQYVVQQGWGWVFTDAIYDRITKDGIPQLLRTIFDMVSTCYDRTFWSSLWMTPQEVVAGGNAPAGVTKYFHHNQDTPIPEQNELNVSSYGGGTQNDIIAMRGSNSSFMTLSARSLSWLTRLSDYVLRNNIGGQRVADYFKSHFGFVPSDMRSETSTWIDTYTDNVTIQDVTNMSTPLGEDGKSSVLGEQGGKGTSGGSNRLKFECKEKGFIIFITQIVPSVGYYQGVKEHAHAITNRFDMYHPDFDGVGMVGVAKDYLFNQYRNYKDVVAVPFNVYNEVLGFAPNYAVKKQGYDTLSGDFLFNSRNSGLDSYHTFRDVLYGRRDGTPNTLKIDRRFMEADNQYQRIFAYTGEENAQGIYAQYDKIFSFISFNIDRYTDMKSLSESMPFFEDEGKRVGSNYEGTQL